MNTLMNRQKLEKSPQCSGWAQRPLQLAQLFYAAQDAYVTRHACLIMARWLIEKPDEEDPSIKEKLESFQKVVVEERPQYAGDKWKNFFRYNPHLPGNEYTRKMVKKMVKSAN